MRSLLPFAASAAAFVLPEASIFQAPLDKPIEPSHQHDSWWSNTKESVSSILHDTVDHLSHKVDDVSSTIEDVVNSIDFRDPFIAQLNDAIGRGGHGRGDFDFPDQSIYELIKISKYTTKFAALVDKHPSVIEVLNSTDSDHTYTLFVPSDEAFERIPEDHKKPSDEFVEELLLYHVGLGSYSGKDVVRSHTVPTAHYEKGLDGHQRLRTSLGFGGLKLNFYSKVIMTDITAKNGYIHGISSILIPPPTIAREISLFPSAFSTLSLAMEKTDFVEYVKKFEFHGSTVFAPSNKAFARLGARANAFLFNTEKGLGYLKAILKYHVVPNATLYTDAFYDKTGEDADAMGRQHRELKTLLDGGSVGVDIGTWRIFSTIVVNGFSTVTVADSVASNGVVHVLDTVLIPPRKSSPPEEAARPDDDISVGELMARLDPYLSTDDREDVNEL